MVIFMSFNWSPMYRRTVGKLIHVSRDIHVIKVKIPLSYKNVNYAGSIFGGSMFGATDPIFMIQLIQILGDDYIVWDKSTFIDFKKPARSAGYVTFEFSPEEIKEIKDTVAKEGRNDIVKLLEIKSKEGEVFARLKKTIFISTKAYYKAKLQLDKKEKEAADSSI